MTAPGGTPGLPSGSVLTLANMESRLQDMSPGAMKSRAVNWFPPMATGTTGGNPASGATPFGVLTGIWSRFNATIAAADPSAVNSVEDLGDLFDEFVHNLPVVGKFVELIEAFTGGYEGDDEILNAIQDLFGTIPKLINGLLSGAWIPQIDASKIISGILSIDLIPGLDVSKIISGIFGANRIPGLDASKIISGKISQTFLDILSIPGNIISSVIDALRIPSLDASKVTTGTLGTDRVPNLHASKITSGSFLETLIPTLTAAKIPSLDASKVTTGSLGVDRVPALPTSKITSGTFAQSMITDLSKLVSFVGGTRNSGTNLVSEPSFEDWTQWGTAYASTWTQSDEQKHSGAYSAKLITADNAARYLTFNSDYRNLNSASEATLWKVSPGDKMYCEAWVYGPPTNVFGIGTAPRINFEIRDSTAVLANATAGASSGHTVAPSWATWQAAAGGWYKMAGYYTIPAGYDRIRPYLSFYANEPAGNVWYVDDLIVREVTESQNLLARLFGSVGSTAAAILAAQVPSLDASKVTSGSFTQDRVTGLSALSALFRNSRIGGSNLAASPDFEDTAAWPAAGVSSSFSGEPSTEQAQTGSRSRKFTYAGTGQSFYFVYNGQNTTIGGTSGANLRIRPGDRYYVEFSYFAPDTNAGVGRIAISANTYDSAGTSVAVTLAVAPPVKGSWQKMSGYYTAGPDIHGFAPYFNFVTSANNVTGDVIYLDNIVIREVTEAQNIVARLFGGVGDTVSNLLAAVIPGLDGSKITSGSIAQSFLSITNIASSIVSGIFGAAQIPSLDASKITTGTFPQAMVTITSIASNLVNGVLSALNIPTLDASKVTTGSFETDRIPDLDAAKVTTGSFPQSRVTLTSIAAGIINGTLAALNIPTLDASKVSTGTFTSGQIPALDAGKITTGQLPQARISLTSIASSLLSGVIGSGLIPSLDASKVTTGTLGVDRVPDLDAAKVTTGTFPQSRVTLTSIAASLISGALAAINIPVLDATKITTGSFDVARVPALPTSKITSGTFPQSMLTITSLASSIISGIFPASQIPSLDATKISTGTLDVLRVPDLAQSKITGLPGALSALTGGLQGIKDRLTGYVNATDTDLDNWILGLLTGDSIPISSLSTKTPNLLPNGRFASSAVLNQEKAGAWSLDAANRVGTTGNGLKVVGGGFNYIVLPRIRVSDQQGLTSKLSVKWSGVTGASAFVAVYANPVGGQTSGWQVMEHRPITGTQGSFIELGGDYAVVDEDTEYVELVLSFADATAGTVWFSDASVVKPVAPGLIPPEVVRGLPDAFDAMGEFVQSLGAIIIKCLTGIPFIGWLFSDLEEEISDWFEDTQATSARADDAWTDVRSTIGHVVESIFGTTSTDPDDMRRAVDKIHADLLENSKAIDALRARDSGDRADGKSWVIDFNDYPNGPLPNIFTVTYTGPGTSQLVIDGGIAQWDKSDNRNRDALVLHNDATDTDFQVSRGTMAAPPEDETSYGRPHFYAVNRSNNSGTEKVWARAWSVGSFFNYKVDIGCTIAGVDYVWVSGVNLTWNMSLAFVCGVGNNPRQYQVFSGSKVVSTFTEAEGEVATYANLPTGLTNADADKWWVNLADGRKYRWTGTAWSHPNNGTAPLASKRGPNNRRWGSLPQLRQDPAGVPNAGGKLSACAVADNELPLVLGTTAMMYRTSTVGVTFSGGRNPLPANFMQFIGRESRDIDADPATGIITILKRGNYYVRGRVNIGTTLTSEANLHIAMAASNAAPFNVVSSGSGISSPKIDQGLDVADMLHLGPGNQLRLEPWKSGTSVSNVLNGGGDGKTIFSATRIPDALAA